MKRLLLPSWLGTLSLAGLLALTPADGDSQTSPTLSAKAQLWKLLVVESLQIVDDPDALHRADSSKRVAEQLAQEIAQAEAGGDQLRAHKLTQLLDKLIVHGIDGNVDAVKSSEKEVGVERQAHLQDLAKNSDRLHNIFKAFEAKLQAFAKAGGFPFGKAPMSPEYFKDPDKFGKKDDRGKGNKFDLGPKIKDFFKGKKGKKDQKVKTRASTAVPANGSAALAMLGQDPHPGRRRQLAAGAALS